MNTRVIWCPTLFSSTILFLMRALFFIGDLINFFQDTLYIFILLSASRPLCPSACALVSVGPHTSLQNSTGVEPLSTGNPRVHSMCEFDSFAKTSKCCKSHMDHALPSILLASWSDLLTWHPSWRPGFPVSTLPPSPMPFPNPETLRCLPGPHLPPHPWILRNGIFSASFAITFQC